MTTSQKNTRSESVRKRRSTQPSSKPASKRITGAAKQAYYPSSVYLPVEPRTRKTLRQAQDGLIRSPSVGKKARGSQSNRKTKNSRRNGYDFAFSVGETAVRAPALSLPTLGPRWISAGLTLLLGILLYTMWTANTFRVTAAEVSGNQRLGAADVNGILGTFIGQPIFKAIPAKIAGDLRIAFPDLAGVSVRIGFPNHIYVSVVERTPILAWYQDGRTTWIDSNGVAFMPRGDVQGLIQISSNGNPPDVPPDSNKSDYDHPFMAPAIVQAIVTLYPQIPGGAPIIFDQKYGVGWQDPRGWSVYFGQNAQDIKMKQAIYQAILDTISQQGIQPTLISVAYLDAPFYK